MSGGTRGATGRGLRILFVSDFFHPNIGGVESHVFELAVNLLARGHTVIVYTHAYEGKDPSRDGKARDAAGNPAHHPPTTPGLSPTPAATTATTASGTKPTRPQPDATGQTYVGVHEIGSGSRRLKVYYIPRLAVYQSASVPTIYGGFYTLRRVLLEERIDLVHAHQAFSAMANEAIIHARTMNIPTVFTDHSLFGFADPASILMNKALKFSLADVQRVICVSHTSRENTVLRACIPPSRVYVIPNAVDMDRFWVEPREAGPAGERAQRRADDTIVVMSRLVYRKGIDLLLRVLPVLCARHPCVRFVIGGDGPKRKALEEMVRSEGLADRVELTGVVKKDDVREFLAQGSIFLNCSLTEAFCVALVEAAAVGLTVVSTSVGGVPEVLPEDMMILAEEASVEGIIQAVEKALLKVAEKKGDPVEARYAAAQRQHEDVVGMYSWQVVASRTERVYFDAVRVARQSSIRERLWRYRLCGKWFGIICVLLAVVDVMLLRAFEAFDALRAVSRRQLVRCSSHRT